MDALNAAFKITPLLRNRRRKQKVADGVASRRPTLRRETVLEESTRR
jgi:hypothetical protein